MRNVAGGRALETASFALGIEHCVLDEVDAKEHQPACPLASPGRDRANCFRGGFKVNRPGFTEGSAPANERNGHFAAGIPWTRTIGTTFAACRSATAEQLRALPLYERQTNAGVSMRSPPCG